MNQHSFERGHQAQWQQLEQWLEDPAQHPLDDLPRLYRQICHHLALAKDRRFSPHLIERLNRLVLRGHEALYQRRGTGWQNAAAFITHQFPALVRSEKRLVVVASLLFYGPFLAMLIAVQWTPELVYSVIDPSQVAEMESMYDPAVRRLGRERQADTDMVMFGFYIRNNISIGFQTFAGGLLATLGSIFFLAYNGLFIGTVAGHLTHIGFVETFWSFVAGHSALELTGIVLSGAAGLRLGLAILQPGRHSRLDALRLAGQRGVRIIGGVFVMIALAAVIEAFWSSSTDLPVLLKYGVGIALWVLLLAYFTFAGRTVSVPPWSPGCS